MADVVWYDILDDVYYCAVERLNDHQGTLTIKKNNTLVYSCIVHLSYSAILGPDVADVSEWISICIDYVDGVIKA